MGSPSSYLSAKMTPHLSYLTLFLLTIAVYFMWMDVALYINVQQVPPSSPDVKPIQNNISDYSYSPFYPLTVKSLFQGPTIHYIDTPLAFWTVTYTNVERVFTANQVSILGVFFAAIAARLFLSDSLKVRQLGVLMFKIRDYIDSLDGCVARARRNEVALTVEPGTLGFYFDGVCDGLADLMMFFAMGFFIYKTHGSAVKRSVQGGLTYFRLDTKDPSTDLLPFKMSDVRHLNRHWRRMLPTAWLTVCVAMQTVLSSTLWNFSLITFHNILETDMFVGNSQERMLVQNEILKSSTYWIIAYFWRLLNPHSVTQIILIAILYNKLFDYMCWVQFLGFLPIAATGLVSFVYSRYAIGAILAA